ncbi:flippase-like domain-containing protein [Nocardioides sp. ChNu-153]|uniref:lysylphosphatidylglycerol synthase domain-containing protein n=1 Tax=unclassified Nocardioides TaxID=2615069 RepID=UPI002406548D|nr:MULTISPECIES: lysylphosphatidylglycerol synthase domain-containing protein [unclassified Nocardioides]MDF9715922.1 flippase-like domain-containing protein [Nocardioides sp. ChNu-99]MDN7122915.1 flippase-like domain-containing protein [Nocardioides sp. ChNu-153]
MSAGRARAWAVRLLFLAVVLGCAAWSLDGRWHEVGDAVRRVHPVPLAGAVLLTCVGLLATSVVWRRTLAAFGYAVPPREARSVFFTSQLGKYVPGAVWAIGVQARLAARHHVPVRVTITTALVFTGIHLLTAGLLGGVLVAADLAPAPGPRWLGVLAAAGCALGLVPAVSRRLLRRAAGADLAVGWREPLAVVGLMALTWTAYALALLLLVEDRSPRSLAALAGAFALGYVAGVLVVVAPAGLGAREATFVAVLSPLTGLPMATAVALLARVVHTVADLLVAAATWRPARPAATPVGEAAGATTGVAGAVPGGAGREMSVATGRVPAHDDDRL